MKNIRTCIACRNKFDKTKSDLIKITKTQNDFIIGANNITFGRSVYVCNNNECVNKVIKNKLLSKAFKQNKKLKSVTVGSNIKSISNNAFFKCVSLKKVNLKTILLTNKTVGKKVFKVSNKRLKIKVPIKVKKSYKKIFKGLKVE